MGKWGQFFNNLLGRPVKRQHSGLFKTPLKQAFTVSRPACPDCQLHGRDGVLLPVTDDPMSRRCSNSDCGRVVTLDMLARLNASQLFHASAQRHAYFVRQATMMFVIASILVSAAAIYSAYRGSVMMFIGGLIVSGPLFMTVFAMRYRAWQARTGRFYEVKAPIHDFIRDELRGWKIS
uniref:hypothetical protein n=1 Tax=Brucella pseudintermedia TaxID=370111 RepID=UPI00158C4A75|nr:hypothetical protein [Brucella pseudintermedia]